MAGNLNLGTGAMPTQTITFTEWAVGKTFIPFYLLDIESSAGIDYIMMSYNSIDGSNTTWSWTEADNHGGTAVVEQDFDITITSPVIIEGGAFANFSILADKNDALANNATLSVKLYFRTYTATGGEVEWANVTAPTLTKTNEGPVTDRIALTCALSRKQLRVGETLRVTVECTYDLIKATYGVALVPDGTTPGGDWGTTAGDFVIYFPVVNTEF